VKEDDYLFYFRKPALAGVDTISRLLTRNICIFFLAINFLNRRKHCGRRPFRSRQFRLKETGRVSLVYRRNHGGYGLIEPENPDVQDET
jgi:hypothetical protein